MPVNNSQSDVEGSVVVNAGTLYLEWEIQRRIKIK
jgi:hypothetical protein